MDRFLISFLIALFIYREIINQLTIQKLINKLMSRNYYDYQITESVANSASKKPQPQQETKNPQPLTDEYSYIGI